MAESDPALVLTKVLATLGPASRDPETICRLIESGVRVVRLNFSHGTFDDFKVTLDAAREGAKRSGLPVGVLGDLSGPKIRATAEIVDGRIDLETGDRVVIVGDDSVARRLDDGTVTLGTTYPEMVTEVQPGHRVLINDGVIRMLATDTLPAEGDKPARLVCSVTHGGALTPKKGINLPDSEIAAPSLTQWDRQCAAWAVEHGVDFLALSFVRKAADIEALLDLLKELGRNNRGLRSRTKLPVIAKIEKPQAIRELDAILDVVDGVMVARGDLGVEMDVAEVPVLQKQIVQKSHEAGKPVIVATQMLESMIDEPAPTRAEVSDVANAILDGADATMLSGETAVGKYPVVCVETMSRTARTAERYLAEHGLCPTQRPAPRGTTKRRTAALARGVTAIVKELQPRYVVLWSQLGGGARFLSHARLRRPILAFSSDESAVRQMTLLYGVHPILSDIPSSAEAFVAQVDAMMLEKNWAEAGDALVIVKGEPLGAPGVTNKIRIHYVGDVCALPGT